MTGKWRPLPGDRGEPRPVTESLDSFARRLGVSQAGPLAVVFAHWEDIVGPSVAAHAKPVSLVQGTLRVAVDQPGWATQLKYLGGELVTRIGQVAGEGVVDRLDVRVDRRDGR